MESLIMRATLPDRTAVGRPLQPSKPATMAAPGRLAQLGEHQLDKLGVTGSSPVPPISRKPAPGAGFWVQWPCVRQCTAIA